MRALPLVLVLLAAPVRAQVPDLVSFQGALSDAAGPVSGVVEIAVSLWDAPSGGAAVYRETEGAVAVVDGVYAITLGDAPDQDSPSGSLSEAVSVGPVYLEATVDGTALSPRTPFLSAPYALRTRGLDVDPAGNVSIDGGVDAAGDVTAAAFQYDAPKARSLVISSRAFRADRNGLSDSGERWQFLTGSLRVIQMVGTDRVDFGAPVQLPDGAVVTALTVYGYDDYADGDMTLALRLRSDPLDDPAIFAGQTVANAILTTTGTSTDMQTATGAAISGRDVIDGEGRQYYLTLEFTRTNGVVTQDLRFYAAKIEYTVAGL